MANTIRGRNGSGKIQCPVASATVVAIGDMILRSSSTGKAVPTGDMTDQGTEAKNQLLASELFLGVSEHQSLSGDTADILVDASPTREFVLPCTSETHEIGDYLGFDNNAGDTALEDAQLVKVTSRKLAIAVVSRRDASASATVYCRLIKSVSWGSGLTFDDATTATAQSAAVTASGVATTFSTGTKNIDGNSLKAGDILRCKAAGVIGTATAAETVTVQILVGTEVIATTGAVDPVSGDIFRLDVDAVVRTAGASGVLACHGTTALGTGGTVTAKAFCGQAVSEDLSSTALAITCKVTNSSTGESVTLEAFSVEIIRV